MTWPIAEDLDAVAEEWERPSRVVRMRTAHRPRWRISGEVVQSTATATPPKGWPQHDRWRQQ